MSAKKSEESGRAKEAKGVVRAEDILAEYEGARVQAESLRETLEVINASVAELSVVRESLNMMKEMATENEILVSLGGGSFARAKITDRERVVVGIGSNVAVSKTVSDALVDVEKRGKELEKLREERAVVLQRIYNRLEELSPTVEAILAKVSKEG